MARPIRPCWSHASLPAGAPRPPGDPAAPRQLPAAAGHFTGRHGELALLTELAAQSDRTAWDTVVISAIDGMAGIGKTALAVHAAHRLSDRFPDGQLFLDLHGHTEGHPPREPGQALESLLRALEVPAQRIPEDTEERAALYRQRLAETRTLILLDNALDEAQVRPLLPGTPGCPDPGHQPQAAQGPGRRPQRLARPAAAGGRGRAAACRGRSRPRAGGRTAARRDRRTCAGGCRSPCGSPARCCATARPGAFGTWPTLLRDEYRRVQTLSDGERDLATVFDLSYTGLDRPAPAAVPPPGAGARPGRRRLRRRGPAGNRPDHRHQAAGGPGRPQPADLPRPRAATGCTT